MKKALLLLPLALLLPYAALRGYHSALWRFNHPSKAEFPVQGIDVSHHQGEIDWEALEGEGMRFVYMKASEGGEFKDTRFAENWRKAERIGMARGAYHFFTFCRPGGEQAANFIATVPVDPDALPPAIDFEFAGNCSERPTQDAMLKELSDFIRATERTYGKPPIIYAGHDSYNAYLKGRVAPYRIWMRDVIGRPRLSDGKAWAIWQYAENGRLKGIWGNVDLNVFDGDEGAFRRFCDTGRETERRGRVRGQKDAVAGTVPANGPPDGGGDPSPRHEPQPQ